MLLASLPSSLNLLPTAAEGVPAFCPSQTLVLALQPVPPLRGSGLGQSPGRLLPSQVGQQLREAARQAAGEWGDPRGAEGEAGTGHPLGWRVGNGWWGKMQPWLGGAPLAAEVPTGTDEKNPEAQRGRQREGGREPQATQEGTELDCHITHLVGVGVLLVTAASPGGREGVCRRRRRRILPLAPETPLSSHDQEVFIDLPCIQKTALCKAKNHQGDLPPGEARSRV